MIREIAHDIQSLATDRGRLRSFGLLVGSIAVGLAAIWFWRADWELTPLAIGVGITGALLVSAGVLYPTILKGPYIAWMSIAFVLGYIMTRIILTIVFLVVVTPIGLVLRALGKDPIAKRPDPKLPSYWIPKEYDPHDRSRYEKLY